MTSLRPSQGIMLQRKCACGGSSETEGECDECKAKHEGTLQRQAANPTVSPAAGVIQTKLAINQPGDEYEQEADRISDQVICMPEPQLQRDCHCGGACPKCQTESLGTGMNTYRRSASKPATQDRLQHRPLSTKYCAYRSTA